jgi:RNAse (barnase) inhibitor barstar
VKVLRIHALHWATEEDVIDDLLVALRAPRWHDHDFDALWDSLSANTVNGVRAPFEVVVVVRTFLPRTVEMFLARIDNMFHDLNSTGLDVKLSVQRPIV